MKTHTSYTLKALATGGILAVTPFIAHADGPNFGNTRVTGNAFEFEDGTTDRSIETFDGRWEFEIDDDLGTQAFNANLTTGHMNFGDSTTTPNVPFHFKPPADGADAAILCDNSGAGTITPRNMFELLNNGAPRFVLTDNSLVGVNKWTFAMNPAGNFTMTRAGVAGAEIIVRTNGIIEMGPGTTTSLRVTNSGIQSTGYFTLSDEATKTDIEEIQHEEILDKLNALPVSTWRFKGDDETNRHIGPMAQDFHNVFGEGDKEATTINLSDMAGVALAGVKSLDQKVEEKLAAKDAEIESLREELKAERERLDRIEKMLMEKE